MAQVLSPAGRDARIIGIISVGHLFSHFYQLTLPPLFPLIRAETGLSYTELGGIMAALYAASGLCQTPAGFLVDRFGARPVLFGGLGLLALSIALMSVAPNYAVMLGLGVLAGIGNSVFHPADYSLMNGTVSAGRIGRAYSAHSIGGHLGFALAPPIMVALGAFLGWQTAVLIVGIVGIVLVLGLIAMRDLLQETRPVKASGDSEETPQAAAPAGIAVLLRGPIVLFFLFFLIMAAGMIGLQSFTASALVSFAGFELTAANAAITAYLIGTPLGILVGGVVADRAGHHDNVAFAGLTIAALLVLPVSLFALPVWPMLALFLAAGLFFGLSLPSRDMVIRAAAPKGAHGRVFGFVYSGLDVGAAIGPLLYGILIDLGQARWVFAISAVLMIGAAALIRYSHRRAQHA
jgi:MFS transporter, FSR family, fosmidomycin resistance protein